MIVANLYFIKNTNGLFYYAVDYLQEQIGAIRQIIVRPSMEAATRQLFPDIQVVVCGSFKALCAVAWRCQRYSDVLYTPTPHPLPLINRQWIVLHDAYPFVGNGRGWKRVLLRLSLSMSRCKVAYINESETLQFAQGLGLAPDRLIFGPNKVSSENKGPRPARAICAPLRVGLVGTDSQKKRYDELLSAVEAAGLSGVIEFHLFGHATPYYDGVRARHGAASLLLHHSDATSLTVFFSRIDVLVSVAELEGFGRPIAAALLEGIPCYLVKNPVFMEFFSAAHFFDGIDALVRGMSRVLSSGLPEQASYNPPQKILRGFINLNEQLKAAALHGT